MLCGTLFLLFVIKMFLSSCIVLFILLYLLCIFYFILNVYVSYCSGSWHYLKTIAVFTDV